ncbi:MAG: tRNA pseudouridine(13) synthase TruD, partial [Pseudomonadales bacterium]|nr:tRNA pseudouridine(13) synthase TruD [Pseudomonadales bacterium]
RRRSGLEWLGLKQDRRALAVQLSNLTFRPNGDRLSIRFFLPKNAYATAVLREAPDLEVIAGGC